MTPPMPRWQARELVSQEPKRQLWNFLRLEGDRQYEKRDQPWRICGSALSNSVMDGCY